MREIRQSGSVGGAGGNTPVPTPIKNLTVIMFAERMAEGQNPGQKLRVRVSFDPLTSLPPRGN